MLQLQQNKAQHVHYLRGNPYLMGIERHLLLTALFTLKQLLFYDNWIKISALCFIILGARMYILDVLLPRYFYWFRPHTTNSIFHNKMIRILDYIVFFFGDIYATNNERVLWSDTRKRHREYVIYKNFRVF